MRTQIIRKKWLEWQVNNLDGLVKSMMASDGCVDFCVIARTVHHSMWSCEQKAMERELVFKKKPSLKNQPKIPYTRGDTRNLPVHADGSRVNYRSKAEEYARSWML